MENEQKAYESTPCREAIYYSVPRDEQFTWNNGGPRNNEWLPYMVSRNNGGPRNNEWLPYMVAHAIMVAHGIMNGFPTWCRGIMVAHGIMNGFPTRVHYSSPTTE